MKKIVLTLLLIIIVLLVGGAAALLFTSVGNNILRPYIEAQLQKNLPVKVELERFSILPTDILLRLADGSVVKVQGDLSLLKRSFDLAYDVRIKDLSALKPLTKADLRGPFAMHGKVKGELDAFVVKGISGVAGSNTSYKVTLNHFKPKNVEATIAGAKLAKLLYMVKQPIYADATIDSTIHLTNLDPNRLAGKIVSKVRNGKTRAQILKKEFDLANAKISFSADQTANISGGVATCDVKVHSSVADVTTTKATFDLGSGRFHAPYVAVVPNLDKLYFVTKQHMKGRLKVTGKVKKEKDLVVTAHSNTLGGTVYAKLLNDDLKADIKNVKFTALTDMLLYPRVFASTLNATLDYNVATKKGKLLAKALDGHILPNKMSFLLQQMANFDITKEVYKETTLTSDINDKVIVSDLDMKSRLTHITSKKAFVDLAKEYVNAKLAIDIKGKPVYVKIKGKIKAPKVSLDAKSLLESRAKKELRKRLKGKIPDAAKGILNNFL